MLITILCCWLPMLYLVKGYPVESKPLKNNPDSWNFGAESWTLENDSNPSASALVSSDSHIKKSKITPKSIFIAPNANGNFCPPGFRIDDKGKCIKTVTIDKDEILAARISELFGANENPNQNSDIDSDYYDDKDSGPLQISIPLIIDIEENGDDDDKNIKYIIEEKVVITMRNLNPKDIIITTEKNEEIFSTLQTTEKTEYYSTDGLFETSTPITTDEATTAIALDLLSTEPADALTSPLQTTILSLATEEPKTTQLNIKKKFSVDFLPKRNRKTSKASEALVQSKNLRERSKDRSRKQMTTLRSTKFVQNKKNKLDKEKVLEIDQTRIESERELTTNLTQITTKAPFWWLPKKWSIDQTKEKPVLVRFWSQQPLQNDERVRSNSTHQRTNSRMPTNIFREMSAKGQEKETKE